MNLPKSQKGVISPPILLIFVAAVGIIIYLLLSSTLPFKNKLFDLLYPKPVSEAKPVSRAPGPMTMVNQNRQIQQPVEQQTPGGATQLDKSLWVVNPTRSPWDPDDQLEVTITGSLAPGEYYAYSAESVIADWSTHVIVLGTGVDVSKKPVTPSFQTGLILDGPSYHYELELTPKQTYRRQWGATGCIVSPDYDRSNTTLIPIPDSNGGVGMPLTITVWVRNTGTTTLEKVGMGLNVNATFSNYLEKFCPGPITYEGTNPRTGWSK